MFQGGQGGLWGDPGSLVSLGAGADTFKAVWPAGKFRLSRGPGVGEAALKRAYIYVM